MEVSVTYGNLRKALFTLLVFCLVGMTLSNSSSAQSKKNSEEALAKRAEIVAVGKVISKKAQWEDNRSHIVTYVTLSVSEYLKGGAGGVVTIATPGGEVDGVGELYSHSASFIPDEEVVVFAKKDKRGRFLVTGGPEGKLSVMRDKTTGKAMVSGKRSLDDFAADIRHAATVNEN